MEALTGSTKEGGKLSREQRDRAFADTFRALGQVSHLVQDATVPAHVRNDPHPPWRPDWYEKWAETRRGKVNEFVNLDPVRPPFYIFTPTGNSQAPVPIARLIDNDRFQSGDFSVLLDPDLGVAEYTNGNFLSRDRMFGSFALPRTNSLDLAKPKVLPEGTKWRRYYSKVGEGGIVDRFVAEGMLWRSLNTALAAPPPSGGWMLDERIQEDYGRLLLPRAVGYSAGLLDYFFRGKLEVDLVPDPESSDPTVVKLSGTYQATRGSEEDDLVEGTLTLYADRPDGTRSPVPSLEPLEIKNVEPGEEISRRFQVTEEAERFVAVYKGKLGEEAPQGDFPGGVIGKVLGGVRAESIFLDFTDNKHKLRTPGGVFPLSPPAESLANIQWGDQDDTFVATNDFYTPSEFLAFKVNRLPDSLEPLLVDGPDGTKVVSADFFKAANFPFDSRLSLGTVNYSQSCHIKQLLVTYHIIDTFIFDKDKNLYNFGFRQVNVEAETVVNQTVQTGQTFPIVLDQQHQVFGVPYGWRVAGVGLDAQQRLLAIVKAELTFPQSRFPTVSLRARNRDGQFEDRFEVSCNERFPLHDLSWAVIDIEKEEVLGVTSSAIFSPSFTDSSTHRLVQQHFVSEFTGGGDKDGTVDQVWVDAPSFVDPNPAYLTVEMTSIPLESGRLQSLALPGLYREDLQALVEPSPQTSSNTFGFTAVHFVDDVAKLNRATRFVSSSSRVTGGLTFPLQAQRIRPSKEMTPELLLLVGVGEEESEIQDGVLVRWSPQSPSNTVLAVSEGLPAADHYDLQFTTSEAALLSVESFTEESTDFFTLLVDLAGQKTQRFNLDGDYVLLDPKFLYNLSDTKFHTLDPSLRATALPRRLADAPRHFEAAYHLIQLR